MEKKLNEAAYRKWAIALSVIIPIAVAALFSVKIDGVDTGFLPPIYASTNGLTAILLIAALIAIKNGHRGLHEKLMQTALFFSAAFLVMYVAYHITSDSTPYLGDGIMKYVYYTILISHILLSIFVIPLVLFTYLRALLGKFEQHKQLARITFPLWLYVAISGVIVYLMISPYYESAL